MSFIQRELEKINEAIRNTEGDSSCLRAAQQALVWALEPDGYASPSEILKRHYGFKIEGTQGTGIKFVADLDATAVPAVMPPSHPAPSN